MSRMGGDCRPEGVGGGVHEVGPSSSMHMDIDVSRRKIAGVLDDVSTGGTDPLSGPDVDDSVSLNDEGTVVEDSTGKNEGAVENGSLGHKASEAERVRPATRFDCDSPTACRVIARRPDGRLVPTKLLGGRRASDGSARRAPSGVAISQQAVNPSG